nr:MAG TPA: hypothetical protein [Caudoviricetes sp.]
MIQVFILRRSWSNPRALRFFGGDPWRLKR